MGTVKIIVGLVIIVASFAYLLINKNQSLMDSMMKKNNVHWSDQVEEDDSKEEPGKEEMEENKEDKVETKEDKKEGSQEKPDEPDRQ